MQNQNDKAIHIRRCHVCGHTEEVENELVSHCSSCGKILVPFLFFNEKAALGLDKIDSRHRPKSNDWRQRLKTQYPPLWGITVYWGNES